MNMENQTVYLAYTYSDWYDGVNIIGVYDDYTDAIAEIFERFPEVLETLSEIPEIGEDEWHSFPYMQLLVNDELDKYAFIEKVPYTFRGFAKRRLIDRGEEELIRKFF